MVVIYPIYIYIPYIPSCIYSIYNGLLIYPKPPFGSLFSWVLKVLLAHWNGSLSTKCPSLGRASNSSADWKKGPSLQAIKLDVKMLAGNFEVHSLTHRLSCMVYLPTLIIKINYSCRQIYRKRPMDPTGFSYRIIWATVIGLRKLSRFRSSAS